MALDFTANTARPVKDKTDTPNKARKTKRFGGGVSSRERMFFTEQLALLIETGMAVHQALLVLQGQVSNPALAKVIGEINESLSSGQSLSYALQQHPELFSTTYVSLVAASEGGGFLHQVLGQLLEMEEKREELRSTLVSAFTYPAFLVSFSILVVIFVLVFVFPKFGTLFLAIKDELPATTLVLLALSDLLREQWYFIVAGMAAGGFMLARWLRTQGGRTTVDRMKLKLPLLAPVFVQLYLVQSLRVLSLSLSNGVTVVDALKACRDVVDNSEFRALLVRVEAIVTEGGKIGEGFSNSEFMPDLAKQMISTAEESGNLALVADRMALFYQRELGKKLDRLAKVIEPIMLLVMGVVVGILVSSLILPIFKLSHAVS
jgi:type II secretory pathway component PulF